MPKKYLLTAFGKDRPGIVADVSEVLYLNDCNLEDTSMSMLSNEFTINLLFSSNKDEILSHLEQECRLLEKTKKISAFVRPVVAGNLSPKPKLPLCTIHVEGIDQAGIVYKISKYLSDHQLNIYDLKSTVKSSPESGTSLYLMDIQLELPPGLSLDSLQSDLNEVAEEINVDITVSP